MHMYIHIYIYMYLELLRARVRTVTLGNKLCDGCLLRAVGSGQWAVSSGQ